MYKFMNAKNTAILADDGRVIPVSVANMDYQDVLAWVAAGNVVADYVPPPITADDVRAEAQRRIIALTGQKDIIGCLIRQHNAQMRATELTLIQAQGGTWTEAEAAEAAALQGLADAIKAIRVASNAIEVMDPIPADYANDSRWP